MKNSEGSALVVTGVVTFFAVFFLVGYGVLDRDAAILLLSLLTAAGAVHIVRLRQRAKKLELQVESLEANIVRLRLQVEALTEKAGK